MMIILIKTRYYNKLMQDQIYKGGYSYEYQGPPPQVQDPLINDGAFQNADSYNKDYQYMSPPPPFRLD